MIYVLLLLFGCTVLAFLSANKRYAGIDEQQNKTISRIIIQRQSLSPPNNPQPQPLFSGIILNPP